MPYRFQSGRRPSARGQKRRRCNLHCYFAAGSCKASFDIVQSHATLSDPHDKLFHGHVNGTKVSFGETWPPGVSEDSWWCSGTTTNGGFTITGTMSDGIGGNGTFTMTREQ